MLKFDVLDLQSFDEKIVNVAKNYLRPSFFVFSSIELQPNSPIVSENCQTIPTTQMHFTSRSNNAWSSATIQPANPQKTQKTNEMDRPLFAFLLLLVRLSRLQPIRCYVTTNWEKYILRLTKRCVAKVFPNTARYRPPFSTWYYFCLFRQMKHNIVWWPPRVNLL